MDKKVGNRAISERVCKCLNCSALQYIFPLWKKLWNSKVICNFFCFLLKEPRLHKLGKCGGNMSDGILEFHILPFKNSIVTSQKLKLLFRAKEVKSMWNCKNESCETKKI